jgi:hypothetical protein
MGAASATGAGAGAASATGAARTAQADRSPAAKRENCMAGKLKVKSFSLEMLETMLGPWQKTTDFPGGPPGGVLDLYPSPSFRELWTAVPVYGQGLGTEPRRVESMCLYGDRRRTASVAAGWQLYLVL